MLKSQAVHSQRHILSRPVNHRKNCATQKQHKLRPFACLIFYQQVNELYYFISELSRKILCLAVHVNGHRRSTSRKMSDSPSSARSISGGEHAQLTGFSLHLCLALALSLSTTKTNFLIGRTKQHNLTPDDLNQTHGQPLEAQRSHFVVISV